MAGVEILTLNTNIRSKLVKRKLLRGKLIVNKIYLSQNKLETLASLI